MSNPLESCDQPVGRRNPLVSCDQLPDAALGRKLSPQTQEAVRVFLSRDWDMGPSVLGTAILSHTADNEFDFGMRFGPCVSIDNKSSFTLFYCDFEGLDGIVTDAQEAAKVLGGVTYSEEGKTLIIITEENILAGEEGSQVVIDWGTRTLIVEKITS